MVQMTKRSSGADAYPEKVARAVHGLGNVEVFEGDQQMESRGHLQVPHAMRVWRVVARGEAGRLDGAIQRVRMETALIGVFGGRHKSVLEGEAAPRDGGIGVEVEGQRAAEGAHAPESVREFVVVVVFAGRISRIPSPFTLLHTVAVDDRGTVFACNVR